MAEARQVAKRTPAKKAKAATPAKSTTAAKATPAKKAAAQKVTAAKSTTRSRGAARTAAAPAAEVEQAATAAARPRRSRPDPNRPAARAARAMRGEPDPAPAPAPSEVGEVVDPELTFAARVDARMEELREQAAAEIAAEIAAGQTGTGGDPEFTARVPFRDRDLLVKMPGEEQLTMYRRVSREFVALGKSGRADRMPIEEALKYLDKAVRTVQSVLVEDDDREWIEDLLLDGKIKVAECTALMKEAFRLLGEKHGNRETRRAAARTPAAVLED